MAVFLLAKARLVRLNEKFEATCLDVRDKFVQVCCSIKAMQVLQNVIQLQELSIKSEKASLCILGQGRWPRGMITI